MAVDNTKITALIGALDARYIQESELAKSNVVMKSATTGLLKNDGTVDTNTYLTQHQDISGKQDVNNLVTAFGSTPSDEKYPSEKLVYDTRTQLLTSVTNVGNRIGDIGNNTVAEKFTALENSISASGAVTITKDTNVTGNVARYTISQGGNALATTIDIPTDMVVQSGQIVENPTGQPAGTYIELTIANQANPIYIDVADLVDAYTGLANQINVSNTNEISIATGGVGLNELASAVSTQWTADADSEIEAYLGALTTALGQ